MHRPCPHCAKPIAMFGPEWQEQRGSRDRFCPSCRKAVVVHHKGTVFATWALSFGVAAALAGYLFGSLACISLLVAAIPVTLFASLHVYRAA